MSVAVTPSFFCRRAETTHSCMQGPGAERS
jgi:hypothetical protein